MNARTRKIRKYQASFGMTRQQAEAHLATMEEKDAKARAARKGIKTYHSDELGRVTVPA